VVEHDKRAAAIALPRSTKGTISRVRLPPPNYETCHAWGGACQSDEHRAIARARRCSLALDAASSQTLCEALDRVDDRCRLA
jgi:hypothetical protein